MGMFPKSRAGATNMGTPLMLLTFAAVAGFMYWLSIAAEPTAVAVVEPTDEVTDGAVSISTFSADTKAFLGQEITLQGIPVTSALGPHAFWTSLADANDTPYLVHLNGDLIAGAALVTPGTTVDVVGTVTAMTDSILDSWESAGSFPGSADRIQAEFAEDFIEVSMVEEVGPAS